jgi:hypothetical protein
LLKDTQDILEAAREKDIKKQEIANNFSLEH